MSLYSTILDSKLGDAVPDSAKSLTPGSGATEPLLRPRSTNPGSAFGTENVATLNDSKFDNQPLQLRLPKPGSPLGLRSQASMNAAATAVQPRKATEGGLDIKQTLKPNNSPPPYKDALCDGEVSISRNGLISDLPDQRQTIVSRRGGCFTMMVAGESGLGKSTFVNTLFNDKFKEVDGPRRLFEKSNNGSLDYYDKTTKIDIREAEYTEDDFTVKFTVIDTPGLGDFSNNNNSWVPIVNYIDEQHRMYMLWEEQPDRSKIVDTRVNACLYFIRPSGHGLLQLDIKVMQELSKRVNLIPVLAKADSFTREDREYFKDQVRKSIAENGIKIWHPDSSHESENSSDIDAMPFAVISSENWVTNSAGKKVRGRQYSWGTAEVENDDHCDFLKLRNVLMTHNMLDLIDSTIERHYEQYRQEKVLERLMHAISDEKGSIDQIDPTLLDNIAGLEVIKKIWPHGLAFLQADSLETDPIYKDKMIKTQERFEVVVNFQEKKFEQWRTELRERQAEYNFELEQIHAEIVKLQNEVQIMESHPYHHRRAGSLGDGKSGRSGRYALNRVVKM